MIPSSSSPGLALLYEFFSSYGTKRLKGLDRTYFESLTPAEKDQAWHFLLSDFWKSSDCITGLFLLNPSKAIPLFKEALARPLNSSPYPAERREMESNRLLMLKLVNALGPEKAYVSAMTDFSRSEFREVRSAFAEMLPESKITHEAVDALKAMIFTETDDLPLTSAITKLMSIHGLDFDRNDAVYRSLFIALNSDDPREKLAAMDRLQAMRTPAYL